MTAVGLFSNVFAGDVHLEGCDYELEAYQNLATYGLFHVTPDPGYMYVRVILKVHNVSDSPKTIFFDDVMIRDEAGRTYSCCGFGFGRNPISTIQPGFSCETEIVFMVSAGDLGRPMSLVMTDGGLAQLPVNDTLEEVPQSKPAKQTPPVAPQPKVVNGRYVYDDSGVSATPAPTPR